MPAPADGGAATATGAELVEALRARLAELEETLHGVGEAHRIILEQMSEGAAALAADRTVTYANRRLAGMLGTDLQGLVGRAVEDLVAPDRRAELLALLGDDISGRRTGEFSLTAADGQRLHANVSFTRLPPGLEATWSMVATDITERIRFDTELEIRVAERTERLRAANADLEALLYALAHDLRAPLRAMDGFSLLLLEGAGSEADDERQDYLARIRAGAQQMGTMIDELMKLASVFRAEVRREPVDLSAIARRVVADLEGDEPGRDVEVVIADGLEVTGDPQLLELAMRHLLSNAWKFTSARQRAHIEVGREVNGAERTFFVKDDGAGFDMKYAERMFQPFRRLHTSAEFPGAGVGLASAHRVFTAHGGSVWAVSEPGAGAIFRFTLGEQDAAPERS